MSAKASEFAPPPYSTPQVDRIPGIAAHPSSLREKEGEKMALYMVQFAYTSSAWTALTKNPEDRSKVFKALVENMGGKLVSLYYAFGEYDGVAIFEAPNETTATAIVLAATTPGHLRTTKTTTLLTVDQAMEAMRKAGTASYKGPRQ
jgi:uncharacterized protein with GYD domain